MEEKEEKMITDKLKPMWEIEVPEMPPEDFEQANIFDLGAQLLQEEDVKVVFSIVGTLSWAQEMRSMMRGIPRVTVHHEATAGFAADAWGRITRRPGVAFCSGGTALTNITTGVVQGYAGESPMVVWLGESGSLDDHKFGPQGVSRAENQFKGICKWVRKTTDPMTLLFHLKSAFRSAVTPPCGPCVVAHNLDFCGPRGWPMKIEAFMNYRLGTFPPRVWGTCEDPAMIEKALKWLLEAERPAMIVGSGIWQDDAQEELREFVHLLGIPCHARRISRGAISEYDPLNAYGRARGKVMRGADRALVMGLRIGYLENDGRPPFFGAQTRHIQAQTCQENVDLILSTDEELIGNCKMLLRQFIDCARDMGIKGPIEKWEPWRKYVVEVKEDYFKKTIERTEKMRGKMPLHPDLFGRQAWETLRDELHDDYIAIIDGFTASSYFTDWNRAIQGGTMLDAAETIGFGHGPGMAVGAGLATDRQKPIIVLMGDGAIGAGGMDIETASRWNIPAVFIHENNDQLVTGLYDLVASNCCTPTGNRLWDYTGFLPKIRYDRMMKEFGCHTEFVERDEEIKPAMKRALDFVRKESKPAFMEVFVDPEVMHEIQTMNVTGSLTWMTWDDLSEDQQRLILKENLINPMLITQVHPSVAQAMMGGPPPPESHGMRKI